MTEEDPRPELTREQLAALFRYVQERWAEAEAEITRLHDALQRMAALRPERFDGTEPINEFIARQRAKKERKE